MPECDCNKETVIFYTVAHTTWAQCSNCLSMVDLSTPITEAPPCKNPSFWRVMRLELRIVKRWMMTEIK